MVFKLFGEIATSSKTTPYSMPYFAIITFNSYSKQLTNTLCEINSYLDTHSCLTWTLWSTDKQTKVLFNLDSRSSRF